MILKDWDKSGFRLKVSDIEIIGDMKSSVLTKLTNKLDAAIMNARHSVTVEELRSGLTRGGFSKVPVTVTGFTAEELGPYIGLTWNRQEALGTAFSGYVLERTLYGQDVWSEIYVGTDASFLDEPALSSVGGFSVSTQYTYRIKALTKEGILSPDYAYVTAAAAPFQAGMIAEGAIARGHMDAQFTEDFDLIEEAAITVIPGQITAIVSEVDDHEDRITGAESQISQHSTAISARVQAKTWNGSAWQVYNEAFMQLSVSVPIRMETTEYATMLAQILAVLGLTDRNYVDSWYTTVEDKWFAGISGGEIQYTTRVRNILKSTGGVYDLFASPTDYANVKAILIASGFLGSAITLDADEIVMRGTVTMSDLEVDSCSVGLFRAAIAKISLGIIDKVKSESIDVVDLAADSAFIGELNVNGLVVGTVHTDLDAAYETLEELSNEGKLREISSLSVPGQYDGENAMYLGAFYTWSESGSVWTKKSGSVLPLPTLQISPRFVPAIPDSPAGTTYRNTPGWTTGVDGWVAGYPASCTLSIEAGRLKAVETSRADIQIYRSGMGAISAKQFVFRVTSLYKIQSIRYWTGSTTVTFSKIIKISDYEWIVAEVITSLSTPVLIVYTTETANTVWYSDIYLGTGAYLTPALDESGSGNNLTNTGVVPGEEDGRKVLLFNGQNSKLVASGPMLGTVYTVIFAMKRTAESIGTTARVLSDRIGVGSTTDGGLIILFRGSDNKLITYAYNGTGTRTDISTKAFTSTTDILYLGYVSDGTNTTVIIDGVLQTPHAFSVAPSGGIFSVGHEGITSSFTPLKLLGLYITDKALTQDQITEFVNNGLPAPLYIGTDYIQDKSADDGAMSPSDKANELTTWREWYDVDQQTSALPTATGSMATGKFKAAAVLSTSAGIWTPTTAGSKAKAAYDAIEAYRKVLYVYSTAGTGFMLTVNRDTTTDISALSPTLNSLRSAMVMAFADLEAEAIKILTRKVTISGPTSFGFETGETVPDPTNVILAATPSTGFTPSTHQWQYYDSGWNNLSNDTGKVSGATTATLTYYYNAAQWGTARQVRLAYVPDGDTSLRVEVQLFKVYDGQNGTSTVIKGTLAEPADLGDIVSPSQGDMYKLESAGTYGGVTYAAGDLACYDGTSWFNLGTIIGPQGDPGVSSYLHIKFSAYADGTGFSDTTNTYIGRAVTTSATAPTDKSDYTWTQWIGSDAEVHRLIIDAPAITRQNSGGLVPSEINISTTVKIGTASPVAYAGRFIIAESDDGSSFTDEYTSSGNESSKEYTPESSALKALRVRFYESGTGAPVHGTSVLIDERTVIVVAEGANGLNGTRTASIELYRWATSEPTLYPVGDSTYTWATGAFTDPATLNGWAKDPGPAQPGETLWEVRALYSDTLSTPTSSITWPSSPIILAAGGAGADGAQGDAGANGTRFAVLELYKWASATPTTFPSGTSTFTWATGTFTLPGFPNGWALNPGSPTEGQKLYACRITHSDSGTGLNFSISWPSSGQVAYIVGMAGSNGLDGNTQGRYIGRYDAHPAAPNNLDRWTCYGAATRGVFYSANGTATPVVAGASASTDAYLSEAFEDIAWSVANGYGAVSAYGVAALFTSIGAGIVVAGEIFSNEITLLSTGFIKSSNYSPGASGFIIRADGTSEFNSGTMYWNDGRIRISDLGSVNGLTTSARDMRTPWQVGDAFMKIENDSLDVHKIVYVSGTYPNQMITYLSSGGSIGRGIDPETGKDFRLMMTRDTKMTAGSDVISTSAEVKKGMFLTGIGIPEGTYITQVGVLDFTISNPATATGTYSIKYGYFAFTILGAKAGDYYHTWLGGDFSPWYKHTSLGYQWFGRPDFRWHSIYAHNTDLSGDLSLSGGGTISTNGGKIHSRNVSTTSIYGKALVTPDSIESGIITVCENGAQYFVYTYSKTGDGVIHRDKIFGNAFYDPIRVSGSVIYLHALTSGINITASHIRFT